MGACADACLVAGGKAIGIIPQFMIHETLATHGHESTHRYTQYAPTKELMAEKSDKLALHYLEAWVHSKSCSKLLLGSN